MAHTGMLTVNNVAIKSPSTMSWGLQDVSAPDAGRTEDALMHKDRVAQKIKLSVAWNNITPTDAHNIVSAFNPEYVNVSYYDILAGGVVTKTFYTGDKEAPFKIWTVGNKRFSTLSFDLIER